MFGLRPHANEELRRLSFRRSDLLCMSSRRSTALGTALINGLAKASPVEAGRYRLISTPECIGYYKVETAKGAFRVGEDEPTPRVGAGLHRRREAKRVRSCAGRLCSALAPLPCDPNSGCGQDQRAAKHRAPRHRSEARHSGQCSAAPS